MKKLITICFFLCSCSQMNQEAKNNFAKQEIFNRRFIEAHNLVEARVSKLEEQTKVKATK